MGFDSPGLGETFGDVSGVDLLYALSYCFGADSHWGLFEDSGGDDIYIMRVSSDGTVTDQYGPLNSGEPVKKGKIVSDGTTVWAAWLEKSTETNPWYTNAGGADNLTWSPFHLVIFSGDAGGFSQVGTSEALTNNHSAIEVSGDLAGSLGKVDGTASPNEAGVAFFCWSEGGFTGTLRRTGCVACGGDCPATLPDGTACSGACDKADFNWMGERFLTLKCDDSAVLVENIAHESWASALTCNYGDTFHTVYNGNVPVPNNSLDVRMVSDHGSPVMFVIWPSSVPHGYGADVYERVQELEFDEVDATTADLTPLQTLTNTELPEPVDDPGIFEFACSDLVWTDPFDSTDVYYVAVGWLHDAGANYLISFNRIVVDGSSDFDWFDGDETKSWAILDSGNGPNATITVERRDVWVWGASGASSRTGQWFSRGCPTPVQFWNQSTGMATGSTLEERQFGTWVYYAKPSSIGRRELLRCFYECPTFTVSQDPFITGQVYDPPGDEDWSADAIGPAPNLPDTVKFYIDGVLVSTAVTIDGDTFYYGDTYPGIIDLSALANGLHDMKVIAYWTPNGITVEDTQTIQVGP